MANVMNREELIKASKNMDSAELVQRLNEDAAKFIEQLPRNGNQNLWSLEDWDKQIKTHPLFATKPPAEGEEMSPLIEAMQQLKYDPDENSPEELARSYKDDGNENFKNKKYRWAVDSYTKGLEFNCSDKDLVVYLYTNRAAAQYHIGNYEKSLRDAETAFSMKPDHCKAIERCAWCCFKLQKFYNCIGWCNIGLNVCPGNKLLSELKYKAWSGKKIEDRNRRKALVTEEKTRRDLELVKKVIKDRNIQLATEELEFDCEGAVSTKVRLDPDYKLIWPTMVLYPEYGTKDYLQGFHEESIFLEHLEIMFSKTDPPAWDKDEKYVPKNLAIYFTDKEYLVPVKNTDKLKDIMTHERYKVHYGTPCFFITVVDSNADKEFRSKYTVVE